ncbi:MAG: bifunctional 4-hydroxy-2-oxoglutarate aldolase/2-dehydro-3-deoxy-phosphogluconate aldolase [Chitinophagaceae bacterium]|nr:bifunctional 4-hydroxy-2-oxoglutarate aldolase/2-dehydro-3-deoxy-phosphogluconate aldolase [Chitinophagaceae bacterium]
MFLMEKFEELPIVGIVRNMKANDFERILPLYIQAGFSTIEVTMNTVGAEAMIKKAKSDFGNSIHIGAGTVCNMNDLQKALEVGADFIVTPIVNKDVIEKCVSSNIPIFPGAFSPTEIYTAWSLGASMVKVFPISQLGPAYIQSIKAPFPQIKLMPTGGVGLEDIKSYKEAGASAFGIGSPMFPSSLIKTLNEKDIFNYFKSFREKWEQC